MLFVLALVGLVFGELPPMTCSDGDWKIDCLSDLTGSADDVIIDVPEDTDCSTPPSCSLVNSKCSAVSNYTPRDCDSETPVAPAAHPPKNPNNGNEICAFYDGSNRFGTAFTNIGYSSRSCGGGLCSWLPNWNSGCYCLIVNGEYFEGKLDLTGYSNPQMTFDYSYTADGAADNTIKIKFDCGSVTHDEVVLKSTSKITEFQCEGKAAGYSDNYGYYEKLLPAACANNANVKIRFEMSNAASNGWGKWMGIKNLCIVDEVGSINECQGNANPGYIANNPDPTASPVLAPTTSPTKSPVEPSMLVDNVCELLDIDFFLNECSLHHEGLKTKISNNDAADVVLKGRVTTLEGKVAADKSATDTKLAALQTQVTNLKNTIETAFNNLASSLGNLGGGSSAQKVIPIFNDMGEIIGEEKLLFTAMQAQYLIIFSILLNVFLIVGIILYCTMTNFVTPGDKKSTKYKYSHVTIDTSDSDAISQ